jgi:hypothetical protein
MEKLRKSRLQKNLHFPGAELTHTHLLQPTVQTSPSPAYGSEPGEARYLSVTTSWCVVISAIPRCGPGLQKSFQSSFEEHETAPLLMASDMNGLTWRKGI